MNLSAERHNKQLYENYYAKPSWWFRFRYDTQVKKKTVHFLLSKINLQKKNLRVFEAGFGSGSVLFSFDPSCEIYGTEISTSAIQNANEFAKKRKYTAYQFQNATGSTLPFLDNYFDLAIASHVIEHTSDDIQFINEIYRILRPGGFALFLIPINERYDDLNHIQHYTSESLLEKLAQCGLNKVLAKIENELLYTLVERFYFEDYKSKHPVIGQFLAAAFNLPASQLPFSVLRAIDRFYQKLGFLPRQFGCIVRKPEQE